MQTDEHFTLSCNVIMSHLLQSPALPSAGPQCVSDTRRSPPHGWPVSGWTPLFPEAQLPSPHCCCSPAWPGRSWSSLPGGLRDKQKERGVLAFTSALSINYLHVFAFKTMILCQFGIHLCPWPSPGWSRHQVLEFPASGSVPHPPEISQVRCLLGRNAG